MLILIEGKKYSQVLAFSIPHRRIYAYLLIAFWQFCSMLTSSANAYGSLAEQYRQRLNVYAINEKNCETVRRIANYGDNARLAVKKNVVYRYSGGLCLGLHNLTREYSIREIAAREWVVEGYLQRKVIKDCKEIEFRIEGEWRLLTKYVRRFTGMLPSGNTCKQTGRKEDVYIDEQAWPIKWCERGRWMRDDGSNC